MRHGGFSSYTFFLIITEVFFFCFDFSFAFFVNFYLLHRVFDLDMPKHGFCLPKKDDSLVATSNEQIMDKRYKLHRCFYGNAFEQFG